MHARRLVFVAKKNSGGGTRKKVPMEFINSFDVPCVLTTKIKLQEDGEAKEAPPEDEFMETLAFHKIHNQRRGQETLRSMRALKHQGRRIPTVDG